MKKPTTRAQVGILGMKQYDRLTQEYMELLVAAASLVKTHSWKNPLGKTHEWEKECLSVSAAGIYSMVSHASREELSP